MAKETRIRDVAKTSFSSKYIMAALWAAMAAFLYYFWAFPYRSALSYREQLQLFQTSQSYFCDLISHPAGMATYIGEFFTQFFNNFWIGAAIITSLMMLFLLTCYLTNHIFAANTPKSINMSLALIPTASLWIFFGNPNVTVSFIVAVLAALAAALLFFFTPRRRLGSLVDYTLMIVLTSLSYWTAGQAAMISTVLMVAFIFKVRNLSLLHKVIFSITALAWLAANIITWSSFLPYPLTYQLIGIGYLMNPDTLDAGQLIVETLCVVVPIVALFLTRLPEKTTAIVLPAAVVVVAVAVYPKAYDKLTYRLIDYDYMVRANDWDAIIRYSDAHDPDLPLSVSATNLALGMTGQLDARAFDYYQHGVEGLIPPFAKETLSSWTTGEIFFQLGMINSAQRFYFEGMEAIPNYNKSSRAIRRLAETAMIRGDYTLARKYLRMLESTIFYKKWAQRNLNLINDPQGVDNHPFYGRLRKRMIKEEYLFSESELDKTLGQLFIKDGGNNLAKQYLILYPLLQRDLNKFSQYMGVVAETQPQYNPLLAQQALAFMSMKNGKAAPKGVVAPMVEQSLRDFALAWTSKEQARIEPYRRTLYFYLLSDE